MQPWTTRGSRCLLRASLAYKTPIRPLARGFTTTLALGRKNKHGEAKKAKLKDGVLVNEASTRQPARIRREAAAANQFPEIVLNALKVLKGGQKNTTAADATLWKRFERYVLNASHLKSDRTVAKPGSLMAVRRSMQRSYAKQGHAGLRRELEYLLYAFDLDVKYSEPNLGQQRKVADLRFPAEWYPQARSMQRTIHLHVGPTNSGKTYHALKRLEASQNGFYAGPLRLLAQEVYHRFDSMGVPVSLVTGDDVKTPEGAQVSTIVSNTVEMVNLGKKYEVGVIDEIQMIADEKRGWAWTRALLGACAQELHVCGETRTVSLMREIAAMTGDKLEIHRYERLNPLKAMNESLNGDLSKLEKGDCVVAFSRVGIHALKNDIEKVTGRRCAMVYGGLPAEIRTQQASLFNDPDNDYDYLVASDAIGMGLNLSCKRIIFETVVKNLPGGLTRLSVPEIKQIGGRAGRYRTAAQQKEDKTTDQKGSNIGYVTSLEQVDLPYIREALSTEPPPITAAGIHPNDSVYEKFAAYFPKGIASEYMIKRLMEISRTSPLFFMCDADHLHENAQVIDAVPSMQLIDQLTLLAAPIQARDEANRLAAIAFATCVAEHLNGRLLDIPAVDLEILEQPVTGDKDYMHNLESLHRAVILYTWLSYRFGGIFTDRTLAVHVKELVEERMVRALTEFSANKKLRKDASLRRQIALQKQMAQQAHIMRQTGGEEVEEPRAEEAHYDDEDAPDVDIEAGRDEYEVEDGDQGLRTPGETSGHEAVDTEFFDDKAGMGKTRGGKVGGSSAGDTPVAFEKREESSETPEGESAKDVPAENESAASETETRDNAHNPEAHDHEELVRKAAGHH